MTRLVGTRPAPPPVRGAIPRPVLGPARTKSVGAARRPGSDSAPKKRRSRKKTWFFAVSVVLLVGLSGFMFWALTPQPVRDYHDVVSAEDRSDNTQLFTALLAAGIRDPFVDVNVERVLVTYERPANATDGDNELFQRFVLGAAAEAAPQSSRIESVQLVNGTVHLRWVAQTSDIQAFLAGSLSEADLDARIEKSGS